MRTTFKKPEIIFLTIISSLLFMILISPAYPGEKGHPILNKKHLYKGVLLVADKNLPDPYFSQTVILITQYDSQGSSGIVINRPTTVSLSDNYPEMARLMPSLDYIFYGGPVSAARISLLIGSESNQIYPNEILSGIYHIDTRSLFSQLDFSSLSTEKIRIYSGFAGWAPEQLENEIERGDWHTWKASSDIIFSEHPQELWFDLIEVAAARWVKNDLQTPSF